MLKHIALVMFILLQLRGTAQLNVDSILLGNSPPTPVLLVGAFHFPYYDLDAHVTAQDKRVNVLEPQRQKELQALVDHIAHFKPTAIAVEGRGNTGYLLRRYEKYLRTDSIPRPDEIDQIAFRLMKRFSIDTLYGVDAPTLLEDLWDHRDSATLHPLLDSIYADWDFTSEDALSKRYDTYQHAEDDYRFTHTLLESFLWMNSDKAIERDLGAYLVGDFKLGKYRGADGLAMHWYARNLRIFRNIQSLPLKPTDRLMVLYGAGHLGILKHLFESSPEFELVKFGELK